MTASAPSAPYYDPYDFEIDNDPHPVWKQLRDECPLYYNDKHDFWALSRWDDVEAGLRDHTRLISGRGTVLELIKSGVDMPPGMILFDDPPRHAVYRSLMSRVFTPKQMNAIEPQVRRFCTDALDALQEAESFDVIEKLGAPVPMRAIGMLLGIPESDQQALRDQIDRGQRLDTGEMSVARAVQTMEDSAAEGNYGEYIDWRMENPSDDVDDPAHPHRIRGSHRRCPPPHPGGDPQLHRPVVRGGQRDHHQARRVDDANAGVVARPAPGGRRRPRSHPQHHRGVAAL